MSRIALGFCVLGVIATASFGGRSAIRTLTPAQPALDELTSELIGKPAPELAKGEWINSSPLTLAELRGKVVLLEFWTYGCYNCSNTIPEMNRWQEKYSPKGLVILGVHTPEFEGEKTLKKRSTRRQREAHPVRGGHG